MTVGDSARGCGHACMRLADPKRPVIGRSTVASRLGLDFWFILRARLSGSCAASESCVLTRRNMQE